MNYQRIDNFLPDDLFEDFQQFMLYGKGKGEFVGMPWFYRNGITDRHDSEGYLFGNDIYNRGDIPDLKLFTTLGIPIISRLPMDSLIRIKVNCHPRQTLRGSENYPMSTFHVDRLQEHTVAILSMNTCNGYTEFEDGTKLESIANSCVIFSGDIKHRSVGQTDENIRVNFNLNFIEPSRDNYQPDFDKFNPRDIDKEWYREKKSK